MNNFGSGGPRSDIQSWVMMKSAKEEEVREAAKFKKKHAKDNATRQSTIITFKTIDKVHSRLHKNLQIVSAIGCLDNVPDDKVWDHNHNHDNLLVHQDVKAKHVTGFQIFDELTRQVVLCESYIAACKSERQMNTNH